MRKQIITAIREAINQETKTGRYINKWNTDDSKSHYTEI